MSLSAHLTSGTAEHGRLGFHPDCPRCRAERLAGNLGADSLVSRRTHAALAAGVLALSAAAPPAVAQVGEADQEQEGSAAPGADEPGLETDFDPGGDDTLDVDTAPVQDSPGAGGQEDDGEGAPVETEPTTDPEADLLLEDGPPVPEQSPAPTPPPTPPMPPAPPAAPPAATPPAAELGQAPSSEAPATSTKRKAPKRATKRRQHARKFLAKSIPAPVSPAPAPVVEPAPPPAPAAAVPVSQPAEPATGPVTGPSYTVQSGDSLWSIARRMLGGGPSAGQVAREVNRLWELNQERIGTGNPSLVHIGTVLRLK